MFSDLIPIANQSKIPSGAVQVQDISIVNISPLNWTKKSFKAQVPTYEDEAPAEAGEQAGGEAGDDALDTEGEDQLHGPEAGHQVGGEELQGPGQGGEGQQSGESQT